MTHVSWYIRQCMKYGLSMIPASLRMPAGLRQRISFLEHSQWWSRDRLHEYQLERINSILGWAEQHIPYYRSMSPGNLPLRTISDLRQWPIVDRTIIGGSPELFQPKHWPRWRIRHGNTSGRSGNPLRIQWEWPSAVWWEKAHITRAFSWAGIEPHTPMAILRGNKVHGPRGPETRSTQYIPHLNRLILSLFQLNEDTVSHYVERMNTYSVQVLQAYPSAAIRFVRLIERCGCEPPKLKIVYTSSEQLESSVRREIEDRIGVQVYDLYGHAERAVAAAQCEGGKGYHVFDEYGYIEILDANDVQCAPNEVGEIVATGFLNRAMPFLRYRTGDFASRSLDVCRCGRFLTLLSSISGRTPEYLIDIQGNPIPVRMGLGHVALRDIVALRFYQSLPGHATLHVVPLRNSRMDDIRTRLLKEITQRFGSRLQIEIKRVAGMDPGPDGRQQLVYRSRDIHETR